MSVDLATIARDLKLPTEKVEKTVQLLDDGNTIPFITRFRKDETGGLNEKQIQSIKQSVQRKRALDERRTFILKSIESQGKLKPDLQKQIESTQTSRRLEDLYLPFKPKKQTLATVARQQGLEPLATEIIEGESPEVDLASRATEFVRVDKGLASVDDVIAGVGHLISEKFSESSELRSELRKILWNTGQIAAQAIVPAVPSDSMQESGKTGSAKTSEADASTTEASTTEASTTEASTTEASATEVSATEVNDSESRATGSSTTEEKNADSGETTEVIKNEAANVSDILPPRPNEAVQTQSTHLPTATSVAQADAANPATNSNEEQSQEPPAAISVDATVTTSTSVEDSAAATTATVTTSLESKTQEVSSDQPTPGEPPAASSIESPAPKKKRKKKKKKVAPDPFKDYFDFKQPLKKTPPHRILAINRGERAGKLKVKIDFDTSLVESTAKSILIPDEHPSKPFMEKCVSEALNKSVIPSLEREIRRELAESAEKHAVEVFANNLKNLLLQPPVNQSRILAIDPGFKRGCSVAAIDETGNLMETGQIFVVGNQKRREESAQKILDLVTKHNIEIIAIGNGTACRETEQMVSDVIGQKLQGLNVKYVILNEAGASTYSTSEIGREELPGLSPNERSAISIGRRLLDPLSELVKISPANIGVGMYQHDIKAKHLSESLDEVVQFCVNRVGVNVNTASPSLLKFVSGLNQLTARRVYEHRKEKGKFKDRQQLKEVTGFGDATFVQAVGFLRICDGDQPLDSTSIHPESYGIAEKLLEKVGATTAQMFKPLPDTSDNSPEAEVTPAPASETTAEASVATTPPVESKPIIATSENVEEPAVASETPTAESSAAETPAGADTTAAAGPAAETPANAETTAAAENPAAETPAVADTIPPAEKPADASASEQPETAVLLPTAETVNPDGSNESALQPEASKLKPKEDTTTPVSSPSSETKPEEKSAKTPAIQRTHRPKRTTLKYDPRRAEFVAKLKQLDINALAKEFSVGSMLINDILKTCSQPRRDPRDGVSKPIFRSGIIKTDDLKPEMQLDAQVVNVVDFGVFVDIGLGESCLIHVSQLSNRFIRNPHQFFAVGDVVKVWVTEIEGDRRRVKLTAIKPGTPKFDPSKARRKPADRAKTGGKRYEGSRPRKTADTKAGKHRRGKSAHARYDRPKKRAPKPVTPITKEMLDGKEPMRSFSDLLQFVEKKPETNADKKDDS